MIEYRLQRFAEWCVQAFAWGWYWRFDLSFLATTHVGAVQNGNAEVQRWSKPIYDAFLAGAWMLHWTEDTLFWVSKPHVHVEMVPTGRRLHNAEGAAVESDVEPLYFWHGVLVPSFVVIRPDLITVEHITKEENAEVRRIMLDRFGTERFIRESGAKPVDTSDHGTLYRTEMPNDEPLVMVKVTNSTAEPDGSFKDYWLRVPPQMTRARDAVAWTFGVDPKKYELAVQT